MTGKSLTLAGLILATLVTGADANAAPRPYKSLRCRLLIVLDFVTTSEQKGNINIQESDMFTQEWSLENGLFADIKDDWRVHVVEVDLQRPGVFYVGNYPYDAAGKALHPDAPAIVEVWDGQLPGSRQISDRQKRTDGFLARTMIAPVLAWHHA